MVGSQTSCLTLSPPTLLHQETLLFAAEMTLAGATRAQKLAAVEAAIADMGLAAARGTRIGNRLVRGASGGERKRAAVACGLLRRPRALFLDEPTSGLDSATAQDVLAAVRRLVDERRLTALLTVHQPGPKAYALFGSLLLLKQGELAYGGPGGDAPLGFFASLGLPRPVGQSTPEFLLDALSAPGVDVAAAYSLSPLGAAQAALVEVHCAGRALAPPPGGGGGNGAAGAGARLGYANGAARETWLLLWLRHLPRYRTPVFVFAQGA